MVEWWWQWSATPSRQCSLKFYNCSQLSEKSKLDTEGDVLVVIFFKSVVIGSIGVSLKFVKKYNHNHTHFFYIEIFNPTYLLKSTEDKLSIN